MRSVLAWMAAAWCFIATGFATDVWFPDSEATSANGRYVVIGKSPENRKKSPRPFQRNFTFELRDTKTQKRLWTFKTGKEDEPGGSLFVSDHGEVIRCGAWEGLWLIRPSGESIRLGDVFDHLPKGEVKAYCDQTTAGTFWSQFSWWEFLTVEGKNYFVIRTYWGRYLIVDLQEGKMIDRKEVEKAVESQLLARSLKILSLKKEDLWEPCRSCGGKHPGEEVARSLMVLERHRVKGRERIIEAFRAVEDDHMHNVVEHIERLRKRRP